MQLFPVAFFRDKQEALLGCSL